MYCFTNAEFKKLSAAIADGDKAAQLFALSLAQMKKAEQDKQTRERVNAKRKINRFYGRSKPAKHNKTITQ